MHNAVTVEGNRNRRQRKISYEGMKERASVHKNRMHISRPAQVARCTGNKTPFCTFSHMLFAKPGSYVPCLTEHHGALEHCMCTHQVQEHDDERVQKRRNEKHDVAVGIEHCTCLGESNTNRQCKQMEKIQRT